MSKKAILIIELVDESSEKTKEQIEKEIRADSEIPWCAKIGKIEFYDT
jgi:hypothetical protein